MGILWYKKSSKDCIYKRNIFETNVGGE